MPKIQVQILSFFLDKLSLMATDKNGDNSIPAMACRAIVEALPHPTAGAAPTKEVTDAYNVLKTSNLMPRILARLDDHRTGNSSPKKNEVDPEVLEILIEIVASFGTIMKGDEVDTAQNILVPILDDEKVESITKKRAIHALSILARYSSDLSFSNLVSHIIESLGQPHLTNTQKKMYVNILTSLARSIPERFGHYLRQLGQFVFSIVAQEELDAQMEYDEDGNGQDQEVDSVRESALLALEAFVSGCPINMRFYTNEVIDSGLRFLTYDPNYNDESDEEMEEDEDDGMGSDDEFDVDDAFDDEDDDPSWKLRRASAKVLRALIESKTNSDMLEDGTFYSKIAPALVNRFKDRDQNARLEIIETMSLLISKTGQGPELSASLPEVNLAEQSQTNSRKRRRDSSAAVFDTRSQIVQSAGLSSPVIKPVPSTGPRADLAKLSPQLVKAVVKQLKGPAIPTKQVILNLLANLATVLPGGLAESLVALSEVLEDAIKGTGTNTAGGSSTGGNATVATLRVAALNLLCTLCETHPSSVLVPMMSKLVPAVIVAANDRYTKISAAGISTIEELVKLLTPPRARDASSNADLMKLFKLLLDRINSTDVDSEIRTKAIHALGILLARTAEYWQLICDSDRNTALQLLLARMKNETSRLAAVRAVDTVATLSDGKGLQSGPWFALVCEELAGQFRKADRALRGSSLGALKNMISTPAAQGSLGPQTIAALADALTPLFNTDDLHLLGPALLVTARLVQIDTETVVTPKLNKAICDLLKSNLGGAVLDALLVLVKNIGECSAGKDLMKALLGTVGVQGADPSVTGRTIGTLLAAGGASTGVKVDSFRKEAKDQKVEINKALALAVLGEIALRAGKTSSITPDDFKPYFDEKSAKLSLAAAVAFGRAAAGDIQSYLPIILTSMGHEPSHDYLLLHSVKEMLIEAGTDFGDKCDKSEELWEKVANASLPEDNKAAGAECIGRLVIIQPRVYLPKLQVSLTPQSRTHYIPNTAQSCLQSTDPAIRAMAYQALRYALPDTSEPFMGLLRASLMSMLAFMLKDPDLENARLALTTLNSATHNKPEIILPNIGQVVPIVLNRSEVKKELVREISLGPFKHLVDDGLDVRKSAYEVLYALLETAYPNLDILSLISRIVDGLKDDREIFSLCTLMLKKLLKSEKPEIERRLDAIAESLRTIFGVKLKDNAVKQEIEKQEEAIRGALRVCVMLNREFPMAGMKDGRPVEVRHGEEGRIIDGSGGVWREFYGMIGKEFEVQMAAMASGDASEL